MKTFLKHTNSPVAFVQIWVNDKLNRINQQYRRLKRLVEFIPVIWHTWDFDYSASVTLMCYQFERTAKRLENGWDANGKYHASRIRLAIKLFEYSENHHYQLYYTDMLENLYGKCVIQWKPVEGKDELIEYNGLRWERAIDDEHNAGIEKVYGEMMKLASDKELRAHKLAWRIVSENIRNWWD